VRASIHDEIPVSSRNHGATSKAGTVHTKQLPLGRLLAAHGHCIPQLMIHVLGMLDMKGGKRRDPFALATS